ncbi:MAG: FAD-dependent oxidoreductase [Planctomycetales bacterium]|nr:FAD-dependent oxidoreductase [Planctomycetales bacterium]
MSKGSVIVVGGGVIGVTCAHYLAQDGWAVTVIDRGRIGGACSHANCGLICPSHVLPLTEPGALWSAAGALLSPNGAFRIKPRLDVSLWRWLLSFARRCNTRDMLSAARMIAPLLSSSMQEYRQLFTDAEDASVCQWQEKGLLFVYESEQALHAFEKTNRILSEQFSEPAKLLDAAATRQLEPALKDTVAGSWFYEHDAHLRPDRLLHSLRDRLETGGTVFVENCDLLKVSGSHSQARRLETSQGKMTADQFVFCLGAWSPQLESQLGCKIPIQPGKGYSITTNRPKLCPEIPLIFPEHRVAVTPMQSSLRLGSIMEFAGYDSSIRAERLQLLRDGAARYLTEPFGDQEQETWFGWRPMTYDSVPIIGRTPRWNNAWLATGHNMLGLTLAPATGRLVMELLGDYPTHLDASCYSVNRFH